MSVTFFFLSITANKNFSGFNQSNEIIVYFDIKSIDHNMLLFFFNPTVVVKTIYIFELNRVEN